MCPLVYSNGSIYTQYASSRASTLLAEVVEGALELRTRKVGENLRRRLVGRCANREGLAERSRSTWCNRKESADNSGRMAAARGSRWPDALAAGHTEAPELDVVLTRHLKRAKAEWLDVAAGLWVEPPLWKQHEDIARGELLCH